MRRHSGSLRGRPSDGSARSEPVVLDSVLRLRAILRLAYEFGEEANIRAVLERIGRFAHERLGWGRVLVTIRDEASVGTNARIVVAVGLDDVVPIEFEADTDRLSHIGSWRDERFRIGRSYFLDPRIGGIAASERPQFDLDYRRPSDNEWHDDTTLVIPIDTPTEQFGAIVVERQAQRRRPTHDEIEELEALADVAANAAANARLQHRLRATAREAEALFRAATLLVGTTDVDALLTKILDAIDEHFGHPICTIHLREPGSEVFALRAYSGEEPSQHGRIHELHGPGVVSRVARTGVVSLVPDVAVDPDYVVLIKDTASELAVPMRIDGIVIGIINVESPVRSAFGESDARVLVSFAEQAAVAVHTAQLHETVRNQARREALVNSIISAVHRTTDLNAILRIPCVGLAEALDVERAYVAVIDWSEQVARFIESYASDNSPVFSGSFPLGATPELSERLERGEVVAVGDVHEAPFLDGARWSYDKFHTRSLIYMPVVRLGDWHAVLLVCCERVRRWSPDEVAFIKTVAEQVGTAFVQAELYERVVESKLEWEMTFDTMSDGVMLLNSEYEIYGANAAAGALLRVPREQIVGMACCAALAATDDSECVVHRSLATNTRIREQSVPRRIGRQTQVTVDPMKNGRGAVVVLRDVSELRRVEADARRHSVVLSQLVSTSSDPIAMVDTSGTILWHNDALGTAVGIGPDAGRGRSLAGFVATDVRATLELELERAIGGEPRFFETALVADRSETWIFATLTPVLDDTVLAGILLVGRDITGHRRAAERAAEADKLRALGQLSSGVAHNFNNALSVILGRTQLLLRKVDDARLREDLTVVEQVSQDASNTVRRIQNFARRRLHESFTTVDLGALVSETVQMTSTRWLVDANAHGINYTVTVDVNATDCAVNGNDSELREVFVNILFNALDAMPEGGHVGISVAREGGFVRVAISDDGCGMSDDIQRRVFEPFFTTKGLKGTGLGLAVSYGIVSRHEGRIEFETAVDRGTTFTVVLPAFATHAAASAEVDRASRTRSTNAARAEILVVDDDTTVCEVVAEALRDRGHIVRCATSAAEALERLDQRPVELVLTDLSMPDMNGFALSVAVHRRWPSSRIVLMSGADVASLDNIPPDVVVDRTIAKPFAIDELCYVVESALPPVGGG